MRSHTSSFSRHLIGSNRLRRPPFFGAYIVFWSHTLIGLTLGFYLDYIEDSYLVSLVAVASCSLGLIVFGTITRQPKYFLNFFSYLLIAIETWRGPQLGYPLSIASLVIITTSLYFLINEQVTTYRQDSNSETGIISKYWQNIAFFSLIAIITAILIRFQTII